MKQDYNRDIYKHLEEVLNRVDKLESTIKDDKVEIRRLNDKIDYLEKENTQLKKENTRLKNDNERLRRIINNDSTNSSLPPSTDKKPTKAANEYNHRTKSKNKQGGQKGHKGTTLTKESVQEKIKNGEFDVPKEYNSEVTYGDIIKSLTVLLYSEGVVANDRIADIINAISNNTLNIASGTIYNFCTSFSNLSDKSIKQIENDLLNSEVLYTDGTVVTENGKQSIIRNASNKNSVLYAALDSKKIESMKASKIWNEFMGIFVHDHETGLYHFGTNHGECNVHLERYLIKNLEESKNSWSKDMISFLSGINKAKKKLKIEGKSCFTEDQLDNYSKRFDEIIQLGYKQNKTTEGKCAKEDEKKLLNRLKKYKENHLLFAHNFAVEYSNNMSERDLRKCKNREKMAGGFRTAKGREMYCNILSIIETIKRRKMNIIENILKIFHDII